MSMSWCRGSRGTMAAAQRRRLWKCGIASAHVFLLLGLLLWKSEWSGAG